MADRFPLDPALVLVTDATADVASVVDTVKAALRGGITHVLLRRPGMDDKEYASLAVRFAPVAAAGGATLLVHARPEVAARLDSCGLHLPSRALAAAPRSPARPLGFSVHSVAEAEAAMQAGVDYVLFGHVFATASHPGETGRGLEALREVCVAVDVPVVAIGGITADHVGQVLDAGAAGVAVQRAITAAPDAEAAAAALRVALDDTGRDEPYAGHCQ